MHGRIKTRTTIEQEEIKKKERAKKVELYKTGISLVFEKRKKGERDESGLAISAKLLAANPDIYTLWNIRREILLHLKTLKSDDEFSQVMEDELRLTEACLRTQPKSYGTWHQRCWVLDHMTNAPWKEELALCDKYLNYDERNFHCWDYRRFIVQRAGVTPDEELKFTDEKIETNFSNYSAWHLRSNLLPQVYPDPDRKRPIEEHKHKLELELVTNAAFTDPYDQSAWFYQRWLLGRQNLDLRITHVFSSEEMICVAFNQSVNPSSPTVSVKACGEEPWETVDDEISSHIWRKMLYNVRVNDVAQVPVELVVNGKVKQAINLIVDSKHDEACFFERPVFESGFSHGVTEVLCNVLESCETLLELEPDTKWPLLTSVLLMQAIDRKKYKCKTLQYLDLLAKVDPLRANYYSDLKSRYIMEYYLEEWEMSSNFSLPNAGLTALYHSQYMLFTHTVNLSGNALGRSLQRLSSLQFCKELNLDANNLHNLQDFPKLPSLEKLLLKHNQFQNSEDMSNAYDQCPNLAAISIQDNPFNKKDIILIHKE